MPSSGSFTVGGGGTYATWALAFAAVSSLTGPITWTQIGPTLEIASAALPGGFLFNGHLMTLTVDANVHQGSVNNRARVVSTNHAGHIFDFSGAIDDPKFIIEYLHLSALTGQAPGSAAFYFNTDTTPFGFNQKVLRYLLIADDNVFGQFYYGIWFDDGGLIRPATGVFMHHILIKNVAQDGIRMGLALPIFGTIGHLENINCSACQRHGFNLERSQTPQSGICRNCFSHTNAGTDFANIGNVVGFTNASEDGSAANGNWKAGSGSNLPNRVVTSELKLGDFYLPDYPQIGGSLIGAGSIPNISGITRDLADMKFPRSIRTIGAHQYSVLETDEIETEDQIFPVTKSQVSGQDVFSMAELPQPIKGFGSTGSDVLRISEEANVVATHTVDAEDVLEIQDAGTLVLSFECIPDEILLRGRTNFWHPIDTLVNELTLPQPTIDDQYNLHTQVRTRHAKGGDLRFFKRNEVITTLLMNFRIERPTRDLALIFLELSQSELVRLYDWEGRWWQGVIVNTPITFTAEGKSNDTEAFSTTLEFEGIRINN